MISISSRIRDRRFNRSVPNHRVAAEIRQLVKSSGISLYAFDQTIRDHVCYTYNEHADALIKVAATRASVDAQFLISIPQVKREFFGRALAPWQSRWYQSCDDVGMYTILQRLRTR